MGDMRKTFSQYKLLIIICGLVIAAWLINFWILKGDVNRGTFGDMFGGINALFTGLAFATLIYTTWMQKELLLMQREDLLLQKEELAATRKELEGQKEQLKQQSKTFELQRFESTLFSLLSVHSSNLANLNINGNKGAAALKEFWNGLYSDFHHTPALRWAPNSLILANDRYRGFYSEYQAQLGPYFRHLYHMFKFINSSNIENKKLYASIVRAQLTSFEQLVLFYNCLSSFGEKFKPLVEEFSLLKGLQTDKLINPEHRNEYSEQTVI